MDNFDRHIKTDGLCKGRPDMKENVAVSDRPLKWLAVKLAQDVIFSIGAGMTLCKIHLKLANGSN
ncbi:hypothetical protein ACX8XN_10290 [Calditrichota bacterium GD2]